MGTRFAYGQQPADAIAALNALDDDATALAGQSAASASAAGASATLSGTRATEAATARDQAVAAWAASMAPAEVLPAFSQSIHSGAIVDAFLYDTGGDSDGGAWRKRCQHTSWYTETIYGTWRGQRTNEAACRAVAGATTGDYYQNTTDGKFYSLSAGAGQTEVFRGNAREFPAQAAIIAENQRVIIYDLTQPGCPMWMVFTANALNQVRPNLAAVAIVNGSMHVATTGNYGIQSIHFISDNATRRDGAGIFGSLQRVASRNALPNFGVATVSGAIVNGSVNDIAAVVLPGAPVDPANGLPVPTIAVATAGGVSVIRDSGNVFNITCANAAYNVCLAVDFTKEGRIRYQMDTSGAARYLRIDDIPTANVSQSSPALKSNSKELYVATVGNGAGDLCLHPMFGMSTPSTLKVAGEAVGQSYGLAVIKRNPTSPAAGMLANVTDKYNTGFMVGDIRGAWLADTVAETITASAELVNNGTFTSNTTGWSAVGGATIASTSGELVVTNTANGGSEQAAQDFTASVIVGRAYTITYKMRKGTGTQARLLVETQAASLVSVVTTSASTISGAAFFTVPPGTTQIVVRLRSEGGTGTAIFDDISVKVVSPDRSVKNSGLGINGSLTKAAVATGAGLVAYSGFGAANYLEQAYSANLDFGTGDFCIMGWINLTSYTPSYFVERGRATMVSGDFTFRVDGGGFLRFVYQTISDVSSGLIVPLNTPCHVAYWRSGGKGYFSLNGQVVNVDTGVATSLTDTQAVLRVGCNISGAASPLQGSIALLRIGATAPTAEQIAHIYRTELPLFQAGAQCTIAGTSQVVTAMAYSENTDLLHVGTSWGRTGFNNLVRVDSEASTVGSITALAAGQGAVLQGGAASGRFYQPAMLLRDELRRKEEASKALGQIPRFFDFDAVTSQTAFALPSGYAVRAVYSAGTLRRVGSTKDYTVGFDGFKESVNFGVAPGNTVWVSIMAIRSN